MAGHAYGILTFQDTIVRNFSNTELINMVRSKDWKLVHYLGDEAYGGLYDLKNDPGEHHNLWAVSGHRQKKEEMLQVLLSWRMKSDNITADWTQPLR